MPTKSTVAGPKTLCNNQLVAIDTLPGFKDCRGYFIDQFGNVYSNRNLTQSLELDDDTIFQIKTLARNTNPAIIARKLNLDLSIVVKAINHDHALRTQKPSSNPRNGYLYVQFSRKGKKAKGAAIHRLVALAFHGKTRKKGLVVRHIDDNKHNNHKDNLRWGTASDNWRDYSRNKDSLPYRERIEIAANEKIEWQKQSKDQHRFNKQQALRKSLIDRGAIELSDYPNYFVLFESDQPIIISICRGVETQLSQKSRNQYGHLSVDLYKSGKKLSRGVHRLVKLAFSGAPAVDKPNVLHIDGNPRNNSLANLKYGSSLDNLYDALEHTQADGLRHYKATDQIVLAIFELTANKPELKQREIAEMFGIDRTLVGKILRGEIASRVEIAPALKKKAQKRLKDSPKKTPSNISDTVRLKFATTDITRIELASMFGVSKKTVHVILSNPNRKDVTTTRNLQSEIDNRLRNNIGAHIRQFSNEQIIEIRKLASEGITFSELGRKFDVHRVSIRSIVNYKTYKNV